MNLNYLDRLITARVLTELNNCDKEEATEKGRGI